MDLAQLPELGEQIVHMPTARRYGRVVGVTGLVVEVAGLENVALGNRATIAMPQGNLPAEVIGYKGNITMLMSSS